MEDEVRVRFPPSPTGYLHIGSARTAIFNWLYAKKNNGKLILRIEDTDVERSTEESIRGIIEGLKWLGIDWDEGPYFQSESINDHIEAANRLLESGHAYKCFCTREALEEKREKALKEKRDIKYDGTCRKLGPDEIQAKESQGIPYTIRLKTPQGEGSMSFEDEVHGHIDKRFDDIEDFVIVRSNGQPLYILSNVVDDIRDRITHIIRGQDGLANTPKQILLYNALGKPIPKFAHISFTLDNKKAKISKRKHGEIVAVHFYRDHGFLPWAFVNFLALFGWSTPDSKQIFSKEELIDAFTLKGLTKANAIFDVRKGDPKFFTDPKAISINAHYIRNLPVEDLEPFVKVELEKAGIWDPDFSSIKRDLFLETIELIRSRYNFTTDFATLGRAYFTDDFVIESKALKKNILKHEGIRQWLPALADRLDSIEAFTTEETEKVIREMAEELNIKAGVLINGIRAAVSGQAVGPGLFKMLMVIGKDRVVKRLRNAAYLFDTDHH